MIRRNGATTMQQRKQRQIELIESAVSCKITHMSATLKTDHPHIVRVEGVCGGEPIIDGLRVTVRHVMVLHLLGDSILDIADALNLTEAQVFHALEPVIDFVP